MEPPTAPAVIQAATTQVSPKFRALSIAVNAAIDAALVAGAALLFNWQAAAVTAAVLLAAFPFITR
jgi:hypothetical protein